VLLSELNRFTINSIVPNHHTNAGRQALRDDGVTSPRIYWLRSAGISTGSPVANVDHIGGRSATTATHTTRGIRPIL